MYKGSNEGGACNKHGIGEKWVQNFSLKIWGNILLGDLKSKGKIVPVLN
jgi:hypothetical protein